MFYESELLEKKHSEVFGKAGAYAQVYSVLCAAMGFAIAVGPAWAGFMYELTSWKTMTVTLAAICALGSVGIVFHTGGPVIRKAEGENVPDGVC